jgi:hypothetical protein
MPLKAQEVGGKGIVEKARTRDETRDHYAWGNERTGK